jgi:hypothetical protein
MIYASQAILSVALFSYCMLVADARSKTRWACASGVILAWFWLTREEGVWIVPAIALIVVTAFLRHRESSVWESTLKPALLTLAAFTALQGAFCFGNWMAYGSFVGVDVKEKNFQAALSAMEAVQVGQRKSYVSVPRTVREKIYEISPSFAQLREFLDPVGETSPWEAGGCMYHKETCGDIGTGFYMWALREAASKAGHYASPKTASAFFGAIATDIKDACEKGVLTCKPKSLPYMPPVTEEQLRAIPRVTGTLIEEVAIPIRPNAAPWDIRGTNAEFEQALRFLNYPYHRPLDTLPPQKINLAGWYFDQASPDGWFDVHVVERNGEPQPFLLARNESPDLIKTFENDKAGHQRFNLTATCSTDCKLIFTTGSGADYELLIGNRPAASGNFFPLGGGTLAFDIVDIPHERARPDQRAKAIQRLVSFFYVTYKYFTPVLLGVGIIACICAFYLAFNQRRLPVILAIAGACWAAVVTRAAILILLDISSFPGIVSVYLYPIFSMSAIAACLSINAAYSLLRRRELM